MESPTAPLDMTLSDLRQVKVTHIFKAYTSWKVKVQVAQILKPYITKRRPEMPYETIKQQ